MNTAPFVEPFSDALTDVQRRVARRADQLRKKFGAGPDNDRRAWLRAEFEVLEQLERSQPAMWRPPETAVAPP